MTGGEFGDDRHDDEPCHGDGPDLDPWQRGDANVVHVHDYLAMFDAKVKAETLQLLLPCLDSRWPEPRLLDQDQDFFMPDRTHVDINTLTRRGAEALLDFLDSWAGELWNAAARDEDLTTSSGLRRALTVLGVPAVRDAAPATWLESTALVRRLRSLAAP